MKRIRKTRIVSTAAMAAVLMLAVAPSTFAQQDDIIAVTLGWAPCPLADETGRPAAAAVRYEVYVQRDDADAELLATVEDDTVYVLAAARGVVQRIRVVGYDAGGRSSPPSDWSDPIYFEPERDRGDTAGQPPSRPALGPNYPNPFNPETRLVYGVPSDTPPATSMALEIYDVRGQRVRSFPVTATPGWHEVAWDGRDDSGQLQATGTYVMRYVCGDRVEVGKMTMLK